MDWQNILVTCVAGGALVVLVRPFLPVALGGRRSAAPACPSCAAGQAACSKAPRLVPLSSRPPRRD